MTQPAGEDRLQRVLQGRRHVEKGRRPRSAVQVLVAAADRQIDARTCQIDLEGTGRVGQIAEAKRTRIARCPGQCPHVVAASAAVVNLGEEQNRHLGVETVGQALGRHQAKAVVLPQQPCHAFGGIEVAGEVALVGEDDAAARAQAQRRPQELHQVQGGAVGHQDRAGGRPDEAGDLVAQTHRQIDPTGLVPAADQALAPLRFDHLGQLGGEILRRRAQGVAVEINDPFGKSKTGAEG